MRVLKPDKGDEKPDSDGDRDLQCLRNRVEDRFPHIGDGEHDEDQPLHEYRGQRDLPAVAHSHHHRIGEVGIEPHPGGEHKGQIGKQRHAEGCQRGGQGRRGENRSRIHPRLLQDAGIDRQDIGHRHKGRNACYELCLYIRLVFFQLKEFFHFVVPF